MTYSEKLQDPRWQKKRLEVMQRDNFNCVCCGDKKTTLNVHHLKYTGEPWEAPNEALITTCKHCHTAIEFLKIEWLQHYKINKTTTTISDDFYLLAIIVDDFITFCFVREKTCTIATKLSHRNMSKILHDLIDFWLITDRNNLLTEKDISNGRK